MYGRWRRAFVTKDWPDQKGGKADFIASPACGRQARSDRYENSFASLLEGAGEIWLRWAHGASLVGELGGSDSGGGVSRVEARGTGAVRAAAPDGGDFRYSVWISGSGGGRVSAGGDGASARWGRRGCSGNAGSDLPAGGFAGGNSAAAAARRGDAGSGDHGNANVRGVAGEQAVPGAMGDVPVDVRDLGHRVLRRIARAGELAGFAARSRRAVPDSGAVAGAGVVSAGGERADDRGDPGGKSPKSGGEILIVAIPRRTKVKFSIAGKRPERRSSGQGDSPSPRRFG